LTSQVTYEVKPSLNSWIISSFDLLLAFIVFFWVFSHQKYRRDFFSYGKDLIAVIEKLSGLLVILLIWTCYEAYISFSLIQEGYFRHQLLGEFNRAGFVYMFLSGLFKLLTPFVLFFPSSTRIRAIIIVGLISSLVITASRSELRYIFNTYILMFVFLEFKSIKGKMRPLLTYFSIVLLLAILVTIFLQGRPISEGWQALVDLLAKAFQYRSYGYILADIAMEAGQAKDVFYPFFGYPADYLVGSLGKSRIAGTEFVAGLVYLGNSPISGAPMLANVVYPWWAWFVGVFGGFGLLLKLIYTFLMSIILLRLRAYSSLIYILSYVLLGTALSHPFQTLAHTVAFATCCLVDFFVYRYRRRRILLS
jgi:hypothetical protein